jgi:two-component system, sensor histidine kinase
MGRGQAMTEAERLAALMEYELLDTPPEAPFDRVTALAADLFETPIAVISLIDSDRQWFKSAIGLDARQTPREHAFCDHTIRSDEVMVVPDAELDERFSSNPLVLDDPNIRFYAGAPLRLRSGHRLGALCVIDRSPRRALTEVERRRLHTLAQIVVNEMDLRLTTARLEIATRAAESANAAKSEFLANMSHEVRTPLTSIIGFAGLLAAQPMLPDRERGFAERIGVASRNLLAIVNDVLDLAKLESGELNIAVEATDVVEVARSAADLVAQPAEDKGLALSIQAEPDLPKVQADPARLRQVLLNLLSNAVKFTDAGSVTVGIRQAGSGIEIAVADTGPGIPADRLDQVFERFVQADASVARRFGGTGLGLPISRRLLERMGGELTAESTLGHGSTFRVRLQGAAN